FGGKMSMISKKEDNILTEYGWEGEDDLFMSQFTTGGNDDYFDGDYDMGPFIDGDKVRDFLNNNKGDGLLEGEINQEDTDAASYDADENIYAYYGMTTVNIGKLMLLGGVRHEFTNTKYNGNTVDYDTSGDYQSTTAVSSEDNYSHFLPMLHLRYAFTPQSNIRAAFTSGIARANYEDLVPYQINFPEDDEMVLGNPDLIPTSAYSFDLLAEHYLRGIGVISGGFFYKSMEDIIYLSVFDVEGGPYDGWEAEQPVNGGSATLYGFEANWQQQMTFLPGFWSGFGLYANYTYTKSEAEIVGRDKMALPGQAGDVANFAVSYEKYGFQGRLSVKYHGDYIDEVADDVEEDIIYHSHTQWDFTASQRITKNLRAYANIVNINNEPLQFYMGKSNRPVQREFYSWWMQAGLKWSL
ncbi:MAG: TonB-dependent receptor, partial [Calditrichia bacterium]|nr:TonB-dependent receptor [Calditrichia bacterium]